MSEFAREKLAATAAAHNGDLAPVADAINPPPNPVKNREDGKGADRRIVTPDQLKKAMQGGPVLQFRAIEHWSLWTK